MSEPEDTMCGVASELKGGRDNRIAQVWQRASARALATVVLRGSRGDT